MNSLQTISDFAVGSLVHGSTTEDLQTYSAYGLRVQSQLPLPEFRRIPDGSAGEVVITFGSGDDWIPAVRGSASSWHVDLRDARFWFPGVGGFRVRNGSTIVISPESGMDNALLRMYVEGMMMATLLFQRGFFVLHASVVQMGGACVAFLGHVGAGKSTTAAALHARGHAVVTDDNAAIDLSLAKPEVTPAFPYVKVFPAIAACLGFAPESLSPMHASQPKCVRQVDDAFPERPVPLKRIYVLTRDTDLPIAPISRAEATIELVRNSVPTRWKLAGGAAHLQQCAQLAARIPSYRVKTFTELSEIPDLVARIEACSEEPGV